MKNLKASFYTAAAAVLFLLTPMPAETINDLAAFEERPQNLQLYARDNSDSAAVQFKGRIIQSGYDSLKITVQKDDADWKIFKAGLTYSGNGAEFDLSPKIHAELSEYKFVFELISGMNITPVITVEDVVCGDVFIINGQSNAHYASSGADFQNEYCRTIGVKTANSNYDPYPPADTLWAVSQGSSSLGPGVGVLGIYIQKYILEEYQIPTCLINGGTGGSVIAEHLPNTQDRMDLNTIYGKLFYRVRKAGIDKIKGIIWHQGENDSDEENANVYLDRFEELYAGWKIDFDPDKVYVFQLHPGSGGNAQSRLREIQRTLPDSLQAPDLSVMSTAGLPGHDGLHYSLEGYIAMAEWIYNLIRVDFYGSAETLEIHPPNIKKVKYYHQKHEIALTFENTESLVWPDDLGNYALKDYFYFDDDYGVIESGRTNEDSVILKLNGPNFFDHVTYLPNGMYNTVQSAYNGPWLKNSRGIGALSFHKIAVENPSSTLKLVSPNGAEIWPPNSEQTIEWTSANVDNIKIEYGQNNGADWAVIADAVSSSQGSYSWTVPDISSQECKIRISDTADSTIADESNNVFGIYAKTITVLSPNGGEIWIVDSTYTISWNSALIENVKLQYSIDSGTAWKTVKHRVTASDSQFDWTVPNDISSACKIKIFDKDDLDVFDISDTTFTIAVPVGITASDPALPQKFALMQNYPNPFNAQTTFEFHTREKGNVLLEVLDIFGRKSAVLIDTEMNAGTHYFNWDAGRMASGIYLYRLQTKNSSSVRKMILLK